MFSSILTLIVSTFWYWKYVRWKMEPKWNQRVVLVEPNAKPYRFHCLMAWLSIYPPCHLPPTLLITRRQEFKYKLALHVVSVSAKRKPNVDPKPIPNPFIPKVVYTTRTSLGRIIDDIVELVCDKQQEFATRYESHTEFDEHYGLKVWNGKRNFKREASLELKKNL